MQARSVVEDHIMPALDSLIGVFDSAYVAQAPKAVGLWQYPGGRAYYRNLVRLNTTTDLTPDAIHAIGLREVVRIEREMTAIRTELGFTGSAREFLEAMRTDPRWYAKTPDEVGERLTTYLRRIEPELPKRFLHLPRARGDVRRLDPCAGRRRQRTAVAPLLMAPVMEQFGWRAVFLLSGAVGAVARRSAGCCAWDGRVCALR